MHRKWLEEPICMATPITLETRGYGDRPVPNTYIQHEDKSEHLGVILPGLNYSSMLACLHYPAMMMWENGIDLLSVDYCYNSRPEFMELSTEERERWLLADVVSVVHYGLEQRSYPRITLLGKSLGTLAMSLLLKGDESFHASDCIWLTPLLRNDHIKSAVTQARPRSLFVIGTADHHYDPTILSEMIELTGGAGVVIEGANHALEIEHDVHGSVETVARIVRSVEEFLAGRPRA